MGQVGRGREGGEEIRAWCGGRGAGGPRRSRVSAGEGLGGGAAGGGVGRDGWVARSAILTGGQGQGGDEAGGGAPGAVEVVGHEADLVDELADGRQVGAGIHAGTGTDGDVEPQAG